MSGHDLGAKTYLGDGAYVEMEDGMVKLTTSNGLRDTNTVYLEPEPLRAFSMWTTLPHVPQWVRNAMEGKR